MYIFEINPLSVASFAIIFSQSEGCLFILLIVSFAVQKLLSFRLTLFLGANTAGNMESKPKYPRLGIIDMMETYRQIPYPLGP